MEPQKRIRYEVPYMTRKELFVEYPLLTEMVVKGNTYLIAAHEQDHATYKTFIHLIDKEEFVQLIKDA